jgi:hypothetical protein
MRVMRWVGFLALVGTPAHAGTIALAVTDYAGARRGEAILAFDTDRQTIKVVAEVDADTLAFRSGASHLEFTEEDELFTFDLLAERTQQVGVLAAGEPRALAWDDPRGLLWAQVVTSWYLVDPLTAATAPTWSAAPAAGATWSARDQGLVWMDPAGLYRFDTTRGTTSTLNTGTFVDARAVVWDADNGVYWAFTYPGGIFVMPTQAQAATFVADLDAKIRAATWLDEHQPRPVLTNGFPVPTRCPGPAALHVTNATEGHEIVLLGGPQVGTTALPQRSPCGGVTVPVASPTVLRRAVAANRGSFGEANVVFPVNLPSYACGRVVVALDLATCRVSDPLPL